jgi:hypothetical protein
MAGKLSGEVAALNSAACSAAAEMRRLAIVLHFLTNHLPI